MMYFAPDTLRAPGTQIGSYRYTPVAQRSLHWYVARLQLCHGRSCLCFKEDGCSGLNWHPQNGCLYNCCKYRYDDHSKEGKKQVFIGNGTCSLRCLINVWSKKLSHQLNHKEHWSARRFLVSSLHFSWKMLSRFNLYLVNSNNKYWTQCKSSSLALITSVADFEQPSALSTNKQHLWGLSHAKKLMACHISCVALRYLQWSSVFGKSPLLRAT